MITIHDNAINQIANDIEYGFPVKNNQIFTQSNAKTILFKIITGCKKLLNCNTKSVKIRNIAIKNELNTDWISSAFSAASHQAE